MKNKAKKALLACIYFLPLFFLLAIALKPKVSHFFRQTSSLFSTKAPLPPSSPPPKKSLPWLKTSGRFIVDENNHPVILRGVNLTGIEWGNSDWFPKATVYAIKEWHANVIRTRVYQDEYFANPQEFFQKLESLIINPAQENGAYVILNPWIGNNNPLPDEKTIQMWQAIAKHYRQQPAVIYDILAEPHDVSREQVWQANQKIIEAIRQVHPRALIMVTGIGWGREINSYLDHPLPYPNIVYRTNPYNKAGEFESLFGRIARFYPVFIGEFGADGYPPMSRESVKALLAMADRFSLGWTAWNFHSIGAPCLLSDFQSFTPSPYGEIVKKALLKKAKVNNLPQLGNAKEGLIIYSDHLENSFTDLSWDAQTDLLNKEKAYQGQQAIKVSFLKKWGALYLASYLPIPTSPFQYFTFFINKEAPLKNLTITLINQENSQALKEVNLAPWSTASKGGWQQISLPLKILEAENKTISGLTVKNIGPLPLAIWIDQIYLR